MIQDYPLYRVVFPTSKRIEDAIDCLSIYAECEIAKAYKISKWIKSRTKIEIPKGKELSFCSYFNAFPASYWKRNTSVKSVTLIMNVKGKADIKVLSTDEFADRSVLHTEKDFSGNFRFTVSLKAFENGGWIWFDVKAKEKTEFDKMFWAADVSDNFGHATASIGVTTLNKADYCLKQLKNFEENFSELKNIDKIYFVDQGSENLNDYKGVKEEIAKLDGKVKIIKQKNLGGSGGFSRGMYETLKDKKSEFVFLLDDDTFLETESLQRAINFASLCNEPTIVGGHMFTMGEAPTIHAFAERIRRDVYKWGTVPGTEQAHNLSLVPKFLSSTQWMHRYYDVDYNGWWMCLIPIKVIEKTGLAIPMFIKWDDSEFGLRAFDLGFKTVSLPGTNVWHEAWQGKDDAVDWTAYYHWRNRFIVALFYLDQKASLRFLVDSYIWTIAMAASMRYSVATLYIDALNFLYNDPVDLIEDLEIRKPIIDKVRKEFSDAQTHNLSEFPHPRYKTDNYKINAGKIGTLAGLLFGFLHQFTPEKHDPDGRADYYIAPLRAHWSRMPNLDSALVASNATDKVSLYKRDRKKFFALAKELTKLHIRLFRDWGKLHKAYSDARFEMSSVKKWKNLFEK
ncbi:MAG: glycosyltransferase [Bifidobacteriaceae bacterium]|jgi:galactofuranosylgalactofuranosylrhamnosyl-N-acetylglucosaminyl-diphospho-decaprenol beta-1,5/1,6-galactofuranosyltransferase|nr:glycosyltransferase [Bifidobacteriaceae bacterium]